MPLNHPVRSSSTSSGTFSTQTSTPEPVSGTDTAPSSAGCGEQPRWRVPRLRPWEEFAPFPPGPGGKSTHGSKGLVLQSARHHLPPETAWALFLGEGLIARSPVSPGSVCPRELFRQTPPALLKAITSFLQFPAMSSLPDSRPRVRIAKQTGPAPSGKGLAESRSLTATCRGLTARCTRSGEWASPPPLGV